MPRRTGAALAVAIAHAVGLAALLAIPAVRPESPATATIRVVLVPPSATVPSPEPPRVAPAAAPEPIRVELAPTPLEVPAFVPPPSSASTNAALVASLVPEREPTDAPPPTIEAVSYVREPQVRYPPLSRRLKEQGLVVVRVLIGVEGRATAVEVQRSSGHPRLDAAACEAVRRAEFRPYVVQGRAVPATALVPIEFSLAS